MDSCEQCEMLTTIGRQPNWMLMRMVRVERSRVADLEDEVTHLKAHLRAVQAEVTRLERLSAG